MSSSAERPPQDLSDLAALRTDYRRAGLGETEVAADPMEQFARWFSAAVEAQVPEPNAMTLATATPDGVPSARIVLLKGIDAEGFVFFTNYESRKGRELATNPQAALVFHWTALERQVRITGPVTRVAPEESERYFHSRPRGSQIGAWVSPQSSVVADRAWLDAQLAATERRFAAVEIPLPPFWGGYRLRPQSLEFWQGRPNRLHDRLRYTRCETDREATPWRLERLAP